MLLLYILSKTTFAENAISTDRPSVGTSALVVEKKSLQLESGIQRLPTHTSDTTCMSSSCNTQYTTTNMIRFGVTSNFEIRPYHDWNFTDRSQNMTGVQGKINIFSSDENPNAIGILVSSGFSSSQKTSSIMALFDVGGDLISGWLNAGATLSNNDFSQSIIVGLGANKAFSELVVNRQKNSQDTSLCIGSVFPFANYQIDVFVLQGLDSLKNQQVGIGFSWQIK